MDTAVGLGFLLVIGLVWIAISLVPWFIAHSRRAQNRIAILVICLLFGWTLIGWLAAFIWAFVDAPEGHRGGGYRRRGDREYERPRRLGRGSRASRHAETEDRYECPECAELVKARASKCRYCGARLNPDDYVDEVDDEPRRKKGKKPQCRRRNLGKTLRNQKGW